MLEIQTILVQTYNLTTHVYIQTHTHTREHTCQVCQHEYPNNFTRIKTPINEVNFCMRQKHDLDINFVDVALRITKEKRVLRYHKQTHCLYPSEHNLLMQRSLRINPNRNHTSETKTMKQIIQKAQCRFIASTNEPACIYYILCNGNGNGNSNITSVWCLGWHFSVVFVNDACTCSCQCGICGQV